MHKILGFAAVMCLFGSGQTLAQNAYITNEGSNNVSVINSATNTVFATISGFSDPLGVAVSPDGSKVYVTNRNGGAIRGFVSVIDTATNTVTATIPVGGVPAFVAVTPDGSKVYVTNDGDNTVSVIDTATNSVIATVVVGANPLGVAVTPDGSKVYVGTDTVRTCPLGEQVTPPPTPDNVCGGGVWVISTATNTVSTMIPISNNGPGSGSSNGLGGVAVSPDGSKVYVTQSNPNPNGVLVIDPATNTIVAMIPVAGFNTSGVAVSPDSGKLYVTSFGSNTASVIDTATEATIATIQVGNFPEGVAVTPDGSKVYVANNQSNTVSVISTTTGTVVATVPVGTNPVAFGIFIGPAPRFTGTPGQANCHGKSVSALAQQFGGLNGAAAALGYPSVNALQNAIEDYCEA